MFRLRIRVLLRQVQAFCHGSCTTDVEKLQGVLRLARFDQKVGVSAIESIAVGKKGQPEFLVVNRRTLLFEAADGLAIPEIGFRRLFLLSIEVCDRTFDLTLQRWICCCVMVHLQQQLFWVSLVFVPGSQKRLQITRLKFFRFVAGPA